MSLPTPACASSNAPAREGKGGGEHGEPGGLGLPAVLVIFFWAWRGTPGKLILGLLVVDARTGAKLDLLQAVIRYLGYFVSTLPLCLGFLWIAFDSRKQGFHDKLARTLVVKKAGSILAR